MMSSSLLNGSLFADSASFESVVGRAQRACHRHQKVRVYRNLNKPEFYSILSREGDHKGLVCGYAKSVILSNVRFIVSKKSRQRVLKTNQRNVHAFCEGYLFDACDAIQPLDEESIAITYNPFLCDSFYDRATEEPFISEVEQAILQGSNVYIQRQQIIQSLF